MARLYLHCFICERKQADGLISGAAWVRVEVAPGVADDHPSMKGGALRVCPTCRDNDPDWHGRIVSGLGGPGPVSEAAG